MALYIGNIAETFWRTSSDNVLRKYGYQYDGLNRLLDSYYQKPNNVGHNSPDLMSYNEHLTYDQNGNIMFLQRYGDLDSVLDNIEIDNLTYVYDDGNKLKKVSDSSNHPEGFKNGANNNDEYGYDDYGNMIRDDNKGISSIAYNHLNLPKEILFSGTPTRNISYIYNALGQKVSKSVTYGVSCTTTDYLGGFHYENEVLKFFATAEGYVNVTVGDRPPNPIFYNYVYNYTDHLGNIRVSYTENDGEVEILEENHYYPFGLKHKKYGSVDKQLVNIVKGQAYYVGVETVPPGERKTYQYKYNGKEYQDELGINLYDFHFRQYMQDLGRTTTVDPHAENYYSLSPYSFLNNNPILFIDPDGRDFIISYIDNKGKNQEYRFNGGNDVLPDNKFVQDFVNSYRYNVGNGGGDSMKAIATNSEATVYVQYGEFSSQDNGKPGDMSANVITWNNEAGLETTNGYVLSPATILDHESAHALNGINNAGKKSALSATPDKQYDNKEEKRVIEGPEQKTARGNREIPQNAVTRDNHYGRPVITTSSTSNKVNFCRTQQWTESFNGRGIFSRGKYKK